MSTTTRVISWLSLLDQTEIAENKTNQIEYEFTSLGGRGYANDRTHADGKRVFRADHAVRGAYDPDNPPV